MTMAEWSLDSRSLLSFCPIIENELSVETRSRQYRWWCTRWEIDKGLRIGMILASIFLACSLVVSVVCIKRRRTKRFLEQCGLPTVFWKPRFMNYRAFEDKQKLAASSITTILPKMRKHGGPYGMFGTVYGITTPVIHIAHPIPAKAVLSGRSAMLRRSSSTSTKATTTKRGSISIAHSTATSKSPIYNHFKNFTGEGVFTADGDDWKAKRAAILHCLIKGTASSTSEISKRLENEANRAANTFCHQVRALQQKQNKQSGAAANADNNHRCDDVTGAATSNIVGLLQRSTIGLIYRYITHADPKWLQPPNMVCFDKTVTPRDDNDRYGCSDSMATATDSLSTGSSSDESLSNAGVSDDGAKDYDDYDSPSSMLNIYLSSILRIRMIIIAYSRSVWILLPRWCYRLFSSLYRDEETTLGPIREFAKMACEDAQPQSPLSRLYESGGPYRSSSNAKSPSDNSKRFNKNMLFEATTILFAGQDTSAATLSWTLHLLSLHPRVQEKLANEIREALSNANDDDDDDNDDDDDDFVRSREYTVSRKMISKLPYLDAIIKESMRLYPVAPFIARRVQEDICIPAPVNNSNNAADDSRTTTILPTDSVALVWIYSLHRNPEFWNRPDDFVPERWIDADLKDLGQSNGAYMPFASGPRNCLGQPIAHVVIRTILARLIREFEFVDVRWQDNKNNDNAAKDLRIEMEAGFTVLPTGGVNLEIRNRRTDNKKMI